MLSLSGCLRVEGSIAVSHAAINGAVVGPIVARDALELLPNARVTGDVEDRQIEYRQIEIQLGAVVDSRLMHQADTKTQELKLASSS
ncbi:MAG: polymer-forming cytoskeletal protein [Candidatus Accumulibacter meliphilus]|jgi:cytoskeletal protein CcmA (bactofilin family)|uniref:Polymer-forming cytoskeletal protein n=1 Tax=Candidatus Accumulibacter meliphilus TaxID=2211374 RepID=A0A369XU39_9PROT|nr:MAG: polymer-forming cytoskeletal protein [Candidatus Accumulibacter meliphilus]